ncbi:MAG: tellurium resistance protein [Fibrobacterota bacterium]|jgi:uncharacterized protein YegL
MRRLPVFLLLDISESMVGEGLQQMQSGLDALVSTLRQDPYALETAHVSLIAFAGKVRTLVPLTEIALFKAPRLPVGSGTSLGVALSHLMDELDRQVVKGTSERKGDWKPIVFLITDGKPTDNVEAAMLRWIRDWSSKVNLVAVGVGPCVPMDILGKLTSDVFHLQNRGEKDFKAFIRWISQSISAQSRSVSMGKDATAVAPQHHFDGLVHVGKAGIVETVDEDFVIIPGKCRRTLKPYLIRYERPRSVDDILQGGWFGGGYTLTGVFALEPDYHEWSEGSRSKAKVNTSQLHGAPSCPHCQAPDAFVGCGCGEIFCIDGPGMVACPTCQTSGEVRPSEGGFEVGRARG